MAEASHLELCILADLADLARRRLLWLRARAYPKAREDGDSDGEDRAGAVSYVFLKLSETYGFGAGFNRFQKREVLVHQSCRGISTLHLPEGSIGM